jgi:thymidylate synthase
MNKPRYHDKQYLNLQHTVLTTGHQKSDRTGTGTLSIFGHDMRFDITDNIIPVLTTKKMHWPSIIHEIIWYLSGTGNIKYLQDNGVRIWNEWADENGDLGPVYGEQWRNWKKYNSDGTTTSIDQIAQVIDTLKSDPDSRRIMVNAWNVGDLDNMQLPPCHYTFQFYTRDMSIVERRQWIISNYPSLGQIEVLTSAAKMDALGVPRKYLSCKLTQRSADVFLGIPFNIAQYSILTCVIAKIVGMAPHEFIWSGGDCHIYSNHIDQVREQLNRTPYPSPRLHVAESVDNIDNLQYNELTLENYQHHPIIKAKVAV